MHTLQPSNKRAEHITQRIRTSATPRGEGAKGTLARNRGGGLWGVRWVQMFRLAPGLVAW